MSRRHTQPGALERVIATDELQRRPARSPDYETESRALAELADALASSPTTFLQRLVDVALDVLDADSAGVSLLSDGGTRFEWPAVAGRWTPSADGIDRAASPCGVVIERDAVQLFASPERFFAELAGSTPPIVEALLAPFRAGGRPVGTLWLVAHDDRRRFDAEDARVLTRLATFAGSAQQVLETLRSLRRSEERAHSLIEATTAIIWWADATGAVVDARRWTEFTGQPAEQMRGWGWVEMIHPDDRARSQRLFQEALVMPRAASMEHRIRRRDGAYRWATASAVPIFNPDGSVREWLGTVTDIDAEKRSADALRDVNQQLEERVQARTAELTRMTALYKAVYDQGLFSGQIDLDGVLIDANDSSIETCGFRREDVIGKVFWECGWWNRSPEIQAWVKAGFEHAVCGEPFSGESTYFWADGSEHIVEYACIPVKDEHGRVTMVVPVGMDVTERRWAERRREAAAVVREGEARFRRFADTAPVMLWITEPDGACSFLSRAWYEYTGQTEATGLGFGWLTAVHPDESDMARSAFLRANSLHAPFVLEHRLRRADGEYRWVLDAGAPRIDDEGAFNGYIGSVMDIHGRKRAEEQREDLLLIAERARNDAETASRAKDEFLAMLGHELRNPLAAVRNAVATASLDASHRDQALAIARRQLEQLGWVVDDLLDVARITQGRITLRREPLVLQSVVERAVEATRPFAESRGHVLIVDVPREPVRVDGDAARLEQVLVNLLSNAVKYTDPRGDIALTLTREGNDAVIRVRDNGMGIAHEVLPRIFDLFTQAARSLDRAQGGLGIGLTVARRLVELHGGRIEAFSEGFGTGSEFVVRIPALAPVEAAAAPAAVVTDGHGAPVQVLMVEDNPDAAEALRLLLEVLGHRVRVTHDGIAALDAVKAHRPDVVLIDIGLPGMDGYEVARRMRADPTLATTTLVALTGYGRDEDREAAMSAGFDQHLVKPVDPDRLGELIRRVGTSARG